MPNETEPRMHAYYYSFDKTGVPEIDLILSAVACAGKSFHSTADWADKTTPWEHHEGESAIDWIQNAANKAAEQWQALTALSHLDNK